MTKDQQRVRCDARMPKRFPKGEPQPGSLAGAQCTLPKGHDGDHTVLPWIGMSRGDSGKDTPMTKDTPDPVAGETPKYRIWVAHCPFKKNGAPSLGTFGQSIAPVVVFKMETWKRLCQDVPQLQTTMFEVGSEE